MAERESAGGSVIADGDASPSEARKPAISRRVSEDVSEEPPGALSVEAALARALVGATEAGRWDVVAQIARGLEARRLAGSNVVAIARPKRHARDR